MSRIALAAAALLVIVQAGCQRQSSGMHLYGSTRVPPPPTNSYTLPQTYYPNSPSPTSPAPTNGSVIQPNGASGVSTPPQFQNTGATQPIGSGLRTPVSTTSGVRLQGMPVNDATQLQPAGSLPTRPAYEPRTGMPAARGLQFIQRTSAEATTDHNIQPASATVDESPSNRANVAATPSASGDSVWRSR